MLVKQAWGFVETNWMKLTDWKELCKTDRFHMIDIDPIIMCDWNKLTESRGAELLIDAEWMSVTDPK